jgi:hypothetical protein
MTAYDITDSTVAVTTPENFLKNLNTKLIFPGSEVEILFRPE